MKAIFLLVTLISVNVFAGSFEIEHRQLSRQQEAAARAEDPQYYAAMEAYRENLRAVEQLDKKLAKLEREKAFLCEPPSYTADHGILAAADTRVEYIKSCKASNRYTEESYKVNAKIAHASQELDEAKAATDASRVLVSYLYAKKSAVVNK